MLVGVKTSILDDLTLLELDADGPILATDQDAPDLIGAAFSASSRNAAGEALIARQLT
ncbi:hypothetical protein [Devosia sp. 2618]|uniref:hypothetical protein n=1 Tax=Devosia sp. 2618 TaxID=3156454 RepID=UPI0033936E66